MGKRAVVVHAMVWSHMGMVTIGTKSRCAGRSLAPMANLATLFLGNTRCASAMKLQLGATAPQGQGNCQCNGAVAYGAKDKWVTQIVHGSVPCNNAQFGDPYPGYQKVCQCDEGRSIPGNLQAPGVNFINGVQVSSELFNQVENLAARFVPSDLNPSQFNPSDLNPFNMG